jgi:hypothetical protein
MIIRFQAYTALAAPEETTESTTHAYGNASDYLVYCISSNKLPFSSVAITLISAVR